MRNRVQRFVAVGFAVAGMAAVGVATALPASAAPAPRVAVCHLNGSNGVVSGGSGNAIYLGRVITVSANAVPSLEARGDSTTDELGSGGLITPTHNTAGRWAPGGQWASVMQNATNEGVRVTNANCAFRLKP